MMKIKTGKMAFMLALAIASTGTFAKLPPPTEEAQLAAEAAKVKSADAAKVAAEQLTKVQDRVTERYIKEQKAKGIIVKPTPIVAPPPPPAVAAAATPAAATLAPAVAAPAAPKK